MSLLQGLHGDGCEGTEYSTCRPVVMDDNQGPGEIVQVVYMEWCGECGAADYALVGR